MGCAPMAYLLWAEFMNYSGKDPGWINRDRFILSAGHGSMFLYSWLNLAGYDLPMDEVKNFRQHHSMTPPPTTVISRSWPICCPMPSNTPPPTDVWW